MPKFQFKNFGDVLNHIKAKGVITAVNSEDDTADVTVEGYEDGSDVPLFYHCDPDSEERSNGAIEGAASGFSVDDEVIVMLEVGGSPVRIVGFVDGIKECGWTEEWGETLCENHDWTHTDANHDDTECPELPWISDVFWGKSTLSLTDSVLFMELYGPPSGSRYIELWHYPMQEGVAVNTMIIKIATTWPETSTAGSGNCLSVYDDNGNRATFVFDRDEACSPPEYLVGDNGGEEQTIVLTDYGLSGDISWVDFFIDKWETTPASMLIDYLRFR